MKKYKGKSKLKIEQFKQFQKGTVKNETAMNAIELYINKKYKKVISILKRVKKDSVMYTTLGNAYFKLSDMENAKTNYIEAIELNPRNALAWLGLGKYFIEQGDFNSAENALNEALKTGNERFAVTLQLAKVYSKMNLYDKAEKYFLERLKLDSSNENVRMELANIYIRQDKLNEAEKLLKEVLILSPKNGVAKNRLGKLHAHQGKYKEAEAELLEGIRLQPNCFIPKLELGKLYLKQGKIKKAEEKFKEASKLEKNNVEINLQLIKVYKKMNMPEEVKKIYDIIDKNMNYDKEAREEHVKKHLEDDLTKRIHGVFHMGLQEVINKLDFKKLKKVATPHFDLYRGKLEKCGYEGGAEGDGHQLDYVTMILHKDTTNMITMFPSDDYFVECPKEYQPVVKKSIEKDER